MSIVETRYGPMRVIDNDVVISHSLSLYGEWAQLEIEILARFIPPGGVVVDAGAFIGTHSRAFSTFVGPAGRVLAFEPRREIVAILEENARLAPFGNIQVRECALGSVQETLDFAALNLTEKMNFGASTFHTDSAPVTGKGAVAIPLDQLELDRVDLIKADVEGMEFDVLQGAGRTIERSRPVVFAEINRISASFAFLDWARNHQYITLGVLTRAFNPENHASNANNCFMENAEAGLLFVPHERWASYEGIAQGLHLPRLETVDDVTGLLLHKPQYPYEVLAGTALGATLGVQYPSPLAAELQARLTELAGVIEERDRTVESSQAELADLRQTLQKQTKVQGVREEELQWLEQSIGELRGMLASRSEQFQALHLSLTEREATLLKLELALMTSARLVHGRDQLLIQRDSELRQLRQTLLERDGVAIYLDEQFRLLKQALSARDHAIAQLKQKVGEYENQLAEQNRRLDEIIQSRSWRLTKPLRLIDALSRLERRTEEKPQSNGADHDAVVARPALPPNGAVEVSSGAVEKLKENVNGDHSASAGMLRPGAQPSFDKEGLAAELRNDFDEEYYRRQNPEIAWSGIDPLEHFLTVGVAEFLDPSPEFSTRYYIETNPDVQTAGLHPFLHYVREGRREGRLGRAPGGFRARHLERLRALEDIERDWHKEVSATPLSDGELAVLFENALRSGAKAVLAFSHDNYTSSVGGTQQCIAAEQAAFEEKGFAYFNFHPAQPLPSLASSSSAIVLLLNILVNGRFAGVAHAGSIATAIRRFHDRVDFSLVVHALHGNAPEAVSRIALEAGVRQAFFWVHDFFAACPGFTLLRNGVDFCGNPPMDSPACMVCVFGERRKDHVARIKTMFDALPFIVVAPSETALDLWKRRSTLRLAGERIHPHCTLTADTAPRDDISEEPRVVRVAFAGFRTIQKGWPVFETLARRLGHDHRYQFHYFGMDDDWAAHIQCTPVAVTGKNRSAMAEVIREKAIDYVVLWAIGPETFSFTTMESLAGGARVLTFRDSGNIARIVADSGQGHVFGTETELFRFFEDGDAFREAGAGKPSSGSLHFTSLTADLVGAPDAG